MIDAPVDQMGRKDTVKKSLKKKSLINLKARKESNPIAAAKLLQPTVFSRFPKIAGILLIGFLLTGVFIFFNYMKNNGSERLVKIGYDLLAEGNYEKAELVFKDALKRDRVSSKVYAGLGQTFLQKKTLPGCD